MADRLHDNALIAALERAPSGGPAWLDALRDEASRTVRESGLPGRKTEAWRFTPVGDLVALPFEQAPAPAPATTGRRAPETAPGGRPGDDGTWRLRVEGGRPRLDLAGAAPAGVVVRSIAEVLAAPDDPLAAPLREHLGRLAPATHFSALNTALFEDGVVLHLAKGASAAAPVHLVYAPASSATDGPPTVAYPRVLVLAEQGSRLTLVESFPAGSASPDGPSCGDEPAGESAPRHLDNLVTELVLGPGARVDHIRVHEAPDFVISRTIVREARDAHYTSRVVSLAGALMRADLHVLLDGPGAECELDGAYVAGGRDKLDHHTLVEHRSPHCTSRQNYRGVLDDKALGVFDGIVIVHRDAQKTEAHQENRNLLLSASATVHTKPHLEIDADDVICTHGATVGSLDEDQLFYLRARGLDEATARAILTYAFVRSVVDDIGLQPLRDRLARALLHRMPEGEALEEMTA
ncbi:MAG: Fe-S cluster assembly protein SufD [Myxococcales bacterium]|nr:Fe-S cluster assembly protein SufD [Myxococcales bacterium]